MLHSDRYKYLDGYEPPLSTTKVVFQIRPAGQFCHPPLLTSHLAPDPSHFPAERGDSHQVKQSETFSPDWGSWFVSDISWSV